jgi:ubiquinone/menaquinone biosynthesis C-methylase UbiE
MVRMTTPSPSAFDPQAFEGTAEYYAVGRPPYSAQLADTIARELPLDGTGQLLDVGCGPGALELPLAPLFDHVTALDPEPGMLQAGQRRCQQARVANVRWVQGVAEDIAALNPGSWRAITFGQSFHRVRQLEVAEAVYDLLVPGGSLILISHNADDGRPRPTGPGHPEVPRAAVRKLILDYLGDGTRHYLATWDQGQPARFEDTLSQTRFGGSRTVYAPGRPDLIIDIDIAVVSCFSLSYAAPRWFGNRRADFESDLRHLLREYSPDGLFWDWPGDTELVIATKS